MATPRGAKDVGFFLVGGNSLLASIPNIEYEREAIITKTTPLGVTWPEFVATGEKRASITQSGFYDATANGVNDAICTHEGTSQVVCLANEDNVAGRKMFCAAGAFAAKYKRLLSQGDMHKANAEYTITGNAEDAVILAILTSRGAAGNTQAASVNNTADSHFGAAGYIETTALALGGYTNLAVVIKDSADNNTFADLIAFTVQTAAPTAERKTVAGDVDQYLAIAWSWTGSGSSNTATFVVGCTRFTS
jgi:hypothetical protein